MPANFYGQTHLPNPVTVSGVGFSPLPEIGILRSVAWSGTDPDLEAECYDCGEPFYDFDASYRGGDFLPYVAGTRVPHGMISERPTTKQAEEPDDADKWLASSTAARRIKALNAKLAAEAERRGSRKPPDAAKRRKTRARARKLNHHFGDQSLRQAA